MREYRPIAAPFEERGLAEQPTLVLFGRRIVRSDGNAQKSYDGAGRTSVDRMFQKGQNRKPQASGTSFCSAPNAVISP
jgi:hypothetical protein